MKYYNPDNYAADSLDENPYWIEQEDGTGYWSDGWTGEDDAEMPDDSGR